MPAAGQKGRKKGDGAMQGRKEDLPVALEVPGAATFKVAEWGETAVAYVQLSAGADAAPLLAGLPGDVCSCPHWGYVLEGAVHVRYADGTEEVSRAGELFYWPPGHTVRVEEDTISWSSAQAGTEGGVRPHRPQACGGGTP
jgi:hypothetical protein